ncbi:MAG: hypothetical protein ACYDH8_01085 [Syntrophales bacterium]
MNLTEARERRAIARKQIVNGTTRQPSKKRRNRQTQKTQRPLRSSPVSGTRNRTRGKST